jgi:hypothetical protein
MGVRSLLDRVARIRWDAGNPWAIFDDVKYMSNIGSITKLFWLDLVYFFREGLKYSDRFVKEWSSAPISTAQAEQAVHLLDWTATDEHLRGLQKNCLEFMYRTACSQKRATTAQVIRKALTRFKRSHPPYQASGSVRRR